MELIVKKSGENTGFCREYYRVIETKKLICLQHETCFGRKWDQWYSCTKDGEPDCKIRDDVKIIIH